MANENLDTYNTNPTVVNETVRVANDYLNKEIAKVNEYKLLNKNIKQLFKDGKYSPEGRFKQCKK